MSTSKEGDRKYLIVPRVRDGTTDSLSGADTTLRPTPDAADDTTNDDDVR